MRKNIAIGCLVLFFIMFVRFVVGFHDPVAFKDLGFMDKAIFLLGITSLFCFWFLMLADFFKNKEIKHKVIWGFCLILFSWLASIIYYIFHFLPRTKKT